MHRRSLPQVVIPVPCHVDWNAMLRIDSDGRAKKPVQAGGEEIVVTGVVGEMTVDDK